MLLDEHFVVSINLLLLDNVTASAQKIVSLNDEI